MALVMAEELRWDIKPISESLKRPADGFGEQLDSSKRDSTFAFDMKKFTKKATKVAPRKAISVEDLIEQGNYAVSKLQPELAIKFFTRASELSPEDTNIMDALADVHLNLGNQEEALQLLLMSTALAPEANPFKWLYLAQLQSGEEAISTYMRAIDILEEMLRSKSEDIDLRMLKSQMAKAYCSIGEIYLTDLCYEENAEEKCEEAIGRAIAVDKDSMDGQQALASLRISQCRTEEAGAIIEAVFHRVKAIRDKVSARTIIEELTGVEESDECKDNPEFEFCIVTAKYLIECATTKPPLAEHAMTLITDLLHDDDENVEIWYMMGVASLSCCPPDTDSARYHLETAKDMMDKLLEECSLEGEEFPYAEHYSLVNDHLRILAAQEEAAPNELKEESSDTKIKSGVECADDQEWSDNEEEEEEEETGMMVDAAS